MRRLCAALLILFAPALHAQRQSWIATWAPAFSAAPSRPANPDSVDRVPTYVNRTLRQIVHTTIGGTHLRLRISNEYGDRPLIVAAVHVALRDTGAVIRRNTDQAITFGGRPSVVLRAGAHMVSDPIAFAVPQTADIVVSMYLPDTTRASTAHALGVQTNYASTEGDHTTDENFPVERTYTQWLFIEGVDVLNPRATGVIVAIGNSITDGYASSIGRNARWPDVLARRLLASTEPPKGVVNAGISGNRVLSPVAGPSALARFDRDVLMQPGVTHVVILEGINDIGRGTNTPNARDEISVDELTFGLKQLADRAHERGLVVIGCTLTPIGNTNRPYTAAATKKVAAVNDWIRNSGTFDAVIDFYRITGDPAHPDQFLAAYDSGDHLHPSDAGYRAMADAIDLALFRRR